MAQLAGVTSYCAFKEAKPPVDRIITEDVFSNLNPPKTIFVADNFKRITICADADILPDITHGHATSSLIEQGVKNANVIKKNVSPSVVDIISNRDKLVRNFDTLFNSIAQSVDKKFDAINLSCGFDMKIQDLAKELKMNLSAENLASKKQEIKKALVNYQGKCKIYSQPLKEIAKLINLLDSISRKGTKIYISAGNKGKEYLNLINLTNDAINVGALDSKGQKASYSADNSLINRWENGDIFFKKVEGGYDITGDGKADIEFNQVALPIKLKASPFKASGTSFSCPRAIVEDLNKN